LVGWCYCALLADIVGNGRLLMLADSHCHLDGLDLEPYGGDIHKAIACARAKNVKYILCPGTSVAETDQADREKILSAEGTVWSGC